MNLILRNVVWIILIFSFSAPHLRAQDSTGFIDSLSRANAEVLNTGWRESWFSGMWFNMSFTDNFSFTYRFYGHTGIGGPAEGLSTIRALSAAMGDFGTGRNGPKFVLVGYVEEDSIWCLLPAVLSPNYIGLYMQSNVEAYWVNESWCSGQEFWEWPPPTYLYEETYVNHDLTIWGLLPPNKTVQVWWGVDAFGWWDAYRDGDLITARNITVFPPIEGDSLKEYADWGDYMLSGSGMWSDLGEFNIPGPEPPGDEEPPAWAECHWDGWVKRDKTSGENWLPEPGSEIGLAFKYVRTEIPATALIRYNVYLISTWQGECMNYPVDAPKPMATGTGEFFDFTIVDTAKYDVEVFDFDTYNGFQLDFVPENAYNVASMRRYVVSREIEFVAADTVKDTLWLKAHDYGAKAIILPSTGATWRDLMKLRTTAFGQNVWSVSVPRDDDGRAFIGQNRGDFMADAWEESVLGLGSPSSDSAVVRFTPFYTLIGDTALLYADRDSIPTGRDIKGDGFCNWEEYRGFITVGNQFGFYPSSASIQHKRLDPFFKNAMVHFMPNAECKPEAPGWMNALPDTLAYLVDHLTSLTDDTTSRLSLKRGININKLGAHYPYYSSTAYFDPVWRTTNAPASGEFQNAVVFWSIYRGDHPLLKPSRSNIFGYVKRFVYFPGGGTIPKYAFQVVVDTDYIELYTANLPYYANNIDTLESGVKKVTSNAIAHEFGHTIGMPHDPVFQYIMAKYPLEDVNNQHRWILDPPLFTRQYSASSKAKISILMEGRP